MLNKFNPLWIPFTTFWIPSQIARIPMANESIKTVIIWCIIGIQVYFLYKGINYTKYKKHTDNRN